MAIILRKTLLYAVVVFVATIGMGIFLMRRTRRVYSLEAYGFERMRCSSAPSNHVSEVRSHVRAMGLARKYVSSNECKDMCTEVRPEAGLCIQNKGPMVTTFHCLPSLLIIGVMKGGTGTMMRWLNEHPQLRSGRGPNNENEVHFIPLF